MRTRIVAAIAVTGLVLGLWTGTPAAAAPGTASGEELIGWMHSQKDPEAAFLTLTLEQRDSVAQALAVSPVTDRLEVTLVPAPPATPTATVCYVRLAGRIWSSILWPHPDLYKMWQQTRWCNNGAKPTVLTKGVDCIYFLCTWNGWEPNVQYNAGWEWRTIVHGYFSVPSPFGQVGAVHRCAQLRTRSTSGLYSESSSCTV